MSAHRGPEPSQSTRADREAAKAYRKVSRPYGKTRRWWVAGLVLILITGIAGCAEESGSTTSNKKSQASQGEKGGAKKKRATKEEPEMTSGERRALESAENYLDLSGFSKAGLMQQLSSSAGEGFSKAEARFAVNNVDVDWKKEAVESARSYLEISPMSKDALIEQLSSSAGENFTPAQARYAANKVY